VGGSSGVAQLAESFRLWMNALRPVVLEILRIFDFACKTLLFYNIG